MVSVIFKDAHFLKVFTWLDLQWYTFHSKFNENCSVSICNING